MHRYETLFVLHPELPEAQVRETIDRVKRLVEGMDGQIVRRRIGGCAISRIPFASSRAERTCSSSTRRDPDVVKELERTMKLADEILRFISVRVPEATKASRRTTRRPRPATTPEQGQAAAPEQES